MAKRTKHSQPSAEDKELQYRIIFESASDGMIIGDLETGRVVDANPGAITMHGYKRDEFIDLHLTTYVRPDSQRQLIESVTYAQFGGA
jgi:PAS domain S-box-containing protein